jgi:hypothetical protein
LDAITKRVRRVVVAPSFGTSVCKFVKFPVAPRIIPTTNLLSNTSSSSTKSGGKGNVQTGKEEQNKAAVKQIEKEQNSREKLLNCNYGRRFVAYITNDRIMGIIRLPLDGNVYNSMGIIAHASTIKDADVIVSPSFDSLSQYSEGLSEEEKKESEEDVAALHILSCGGSDYSVEAWSVDLEALETACDLQNAALSSFSPSEETYTASATSPTPSPSSSSSSSSSSTSTFSFDYSTQLEGGTNGELHNYIINMFYYGQLRSQGEGIFFN